MKIFDQPLVIFLVIFATLHDGAGFASSHGLQQREHHPRACPTRSRAQLYFPSHPNERHANSQGPRQRGWPGRVRCLCRTAACAESRKCHRTLEKMSIAEASGAPEWRARRRRALGRQGSVTFKAGMIPGNLAPTASKILCAPELLPAQTVIWTASQTVGQTLRVAAAGVFRPDSRKYHPPIVRSRAIKAQALRHHLGDW
jgi:hypothetical protein